MNGRLLSLIIAAALWSWNLGAQGFQWVKQTGMNGAPTRFRVAVDSSGNVYETGSVWGTASFGNMILTSRGDYDAFLAKYDKGGNLLWLKQAGGTSRDMGNDVSVDAAGNVYMIGSFQGTATFDGTNLTTTGSVSMGTVNNVFISKYNSGGTLLWV